MKILFCSLIALFILSCKDSSNLIYEIDPNSFNQNAIYLSDIAVDINYIQLDNVIKFVNYKYIVNSSSIYLSAKEIGILKFDRNGKFLRRIGDSGRGPGEFKLGMSFTVDEITGNVYVLDWRKIKVYSQAGTFIRDISYDGFIGSSEMPGDIELFNSYLYLPDYNINGDSKFDWVILDTLGNLISSKKNVIPSFSTNIGMDGSLYNYNGNLCYFNLYNDTVFSISPDLSYKANFKFSQGEHRWPKKKVDMSLNFNLSKYFRPFNMFETNKYIVFRYYFLDKYAWAFIDKETKKTFLSFKYENLISGGKACKPYLINDLDGGPDLSEWIQYYTENDNEFIVLLVNPIDLIKKINSEWFKENSVKFPEMKRSLEEMVNNLDESDNPILMMIKLKGNDEV